MPGFVKRPRRTIVVANRLPRKSEMPPHASAAGSKPARSPTPAGGLRSSQAAEVARVLKPDGHFSCNEIALGSGGDPIFPLAWADDEASRFLVSPAKMRAALEASSLCVIEQVDLTATRLGETGRQPVIERDDFPLRLHNLQNCLADERLVAEFILAKKKSAQRGSIARNARRRAL